MITFFASLLLKFPFLKTAKDFLFSKKILTIIIAGIVVLFLVTQVTSCASNYIDKEVKYETKINSNKVEIDQLKHQVETIENNQKIVDEILIDNSKIKKDQETKSRQIKDKINEEVKNGNDGYVGPIISSTIDSL